MKDLLNKLRKLLVLITLKKPGSQPLLLAIADDIVRFSPEFRFEQAVAQLPTSALTDDYYYQSQLVKLNHFFDNLKLLEELLIQFAKLVSANQVFTDEYKLSVIDAIKNIINCIYTQRLATVRSHLLCHDNFRQLINTKTIVFKNVMANVDKLICQYQHFFNTASLADLIKFKRDIGEQLSIIRNIFCHTNYDLGFYIYDETTKKAVLFSEVFLNLECLVHLEKVMLVYSEAIVNLIKAQSFTVPSKDQLSDEDYLKSLFRFKSRLHEYKITLQGAYPVKLDFIDQLADNDIWNHIKDYRIIGQQLKINIDVLICEINKLDNTANQLIKKYNISFAKLEEIKASAAGASQSIYKRIRTLYTSGTVGDPERIDLKKTNTTNIVEFNYFDNEFDKLNGDNELKEYMCNANQLENLIKQTYVQFKQITTTLSKEDNFDYVDEIVTHKTLDTIVNCADVLKSLMAKLLSSDNQSLSVEEIYYSLQQLLNNIKIRHKQPFQTLINAADYLNELSVKILEPANTVILMAVTEVKKVIDYHAGQINIALNKLANSIDMKQVDKLNFKEMIEDIFPLLDNPNAVDYGAQLLAFPKYLDKIINNIIHERNVYTYKILVLHQDIAELLNSGDYSNEIINDKKLQIAYYEHIVQFYDVLTKQLNTSKNQLRRALHIAPNSLIVFGKLPAIQDDRNLIISDQDAQSCNIEMPTNIKEAVFEEVADHPLLNEIVLTDSKNEIVNNEQKIFTLKPTKIIPALITLIKSIYGEDSNDYDIYQSLNNAIDTTFDNSIPATKPRWWQFSQKLVYQDAEAQKFIYDEIKKNNDGCATTYKNIQDKINEIKPKWWQIWRFGKEEQARKLRYAEWENKAFLLCIIKSFVNGHIKHNELFRKLNSLILKSNDIMSVSIQSFIDSVNCHSNIKIYNKLGIDNQSSGDVVFQDNGLTPGKAIFHKVNNQKNCNSLRTRRDHMLSTLHNLKMF